METSRFYFGFWVIDKPEREKVPEKKRDVKANFTACQQ